MPYKKCDENLGRVLDRFDPNTPVFLYFKGGTAYFDRGVSKAGELCDSRKYRHLEEDEQLRLLKQFTDRADLRHIRQIAEAGDSSLVEDLASILEAVHARLEELG